MATCGKCKAPDVTVQHVRECYQAAQEHATIGQPPVAVQTRPAPAPPPAELEAGIYRNPLTGRIFKVYCAVHGSGKMCAKELVVDLPWVRDDAGKVLQEGKAHFEYRGLAQRFVKPYHRMSLDEAKQFGAIYGVCVRCGATLTDEKSIARGMGPKCASKM